MKRPKHDNRAAIRGLRVEIDRIDREVVTLLNRRARMARRIGVLKAKLGTPIFEPGREAEVLARVAARSRAPLTVSSVEQIFRAVMKVMRELQRTKPSVGGSRT